MSIAADIKRDKDAFEGHVGTHKCRPAATGGLCLERIELWQAYMRTSALWGKEPDDDARQRDHFNRNLRPAAA